MAGRGAWVLLSAFSLLLFKGCATGPAFVAAPEPWRDDEEQACLASGYVRESATLVSRAALGGPSVCGAARPFVMSAAKSGRVRLEPPALLRCPMIPQVEAWIAAIVEPAAVNRFGTPVVEIAVAASYSCRPMNGQFGARLSEHGHANALDVRAFHLADGRSVSVREGWAGPPLEGAFLREVHDGGCEFFTTVLGPDHDSFHRDHLHLDLARRGRDGGDRICK